MLASQKRPNKWAVKSAREKQPRAEDLVTRWNICKGDRVEVLRGKEAGKQGVVRKVLRAENRVVVRGVNLVKKPIPARAARAQPGAVAGSLLTVEAPLHYSNVALVDPTTDQPTKVVRRLVDGDRVRVSRLSGAVIEKAKFLTRRLARVPKLDSPLDTPPDVALKLTFDARSLLPWPNAVPPPDWRPRIASVAPQLPKPAHLTLRDRKAAKLAPSSSSSSSSSAAAASSSSTTTKADEPTQV